MLRVVLVVGAAVLCGLVAVVLTAFVLLVVHSNIGFSTCRLPGPNGPEVCSSSSGNWVFLAAGAAGAVLGGAGTVMWIRHRDRLPDKSVALHSQ